MANGFSRSIRTRRASTRPWCIRRPRRWQAGRPRTTSSSSRTSLKRAAGRPQCACRPSTSYACRCDVWAQHMWSSAISLFRALQSGHVICYMVFTVPRGIIRGGRGAHRCGVAPLCGCVECLERVCRVFGEETNPKKTHSFRKPTGKTRARPRGEDSSLKNQEHMYL